jgi:DNA-3-methyladenine glycosylase
VRRTLPKAFYSKKNPVCVAKQLLGKVLWVRGKGGVCRARIVETEAYGGSLDRASHAWRGRTRRNEPMFGTPGTAYVYLCYGIHRMFNVVTGPTGWPAAVLIRGVEPMEGADRMARRRGVSVNDFRLSSGPGALTEAMGIESDADRCDLVSGSIRIEDDGVRYPKTKIQAGRRVGVSYAGPAASFPWRFSVRGNPWVSRARA